MARGGSREGAGRKARAKEAPEAKAEPHASSRDHGAVGRPSLYQGEFAVQAEKLCKMGATDHDLADFFEVSLRSISNWQVAHPEFMQAMRSGKDVADDRVERALYLKAVGYSHDAVKIYANNRTGENVVVPYVAHIPPDTTAISLWLRNRRAKDWRDGGKDFEPEVEAEGMTLKERLEFDRPIIVTSEPGPDVL
jgi:hypothetical protein